MKIIVIYNTFDINKLLDESKHIYQMKVNIKCKTYNIKSTLKIIFLTSYLSFE